MEEEEKTRTSVIPVGNQKIIRNKRLIRPRTIKDYKNRNIVAQFARNNSRCFKVELGKTDRVHNNKQLLRKDCERLEQPG